MFNQSQLELWVSPSEVERTVLWVQSRGLEAIVSVSTDAYGKAIAIVRGIRKTTAWVQ